MKAWFTKAWGVLRETFSRWSKDDGGLLSAAMSYYAAFSMFPLFLVLISALGWAMRLSPVAKDAQQELLAVVARNAGSGFAEHITAVLGGVQTHAPIGGPLGLLGLLVGAIGIFTQFDAIFGRLWGARANPHKGIWGAIRGALFDRLIAFSMLVGIGFLVCLVFLADLLLVGIRPHVVELPAGQIAWAAGQMAFTVGCNAFLLGVIYRYLPREPVRWKEAAIGGAAVAIVWEVGKQILAAIVIADKYTAYGVVGSFIAIMLWIYYASASIFLGAELVQVLCSGCASNQKAGARPD